MKYNRLVRTWSQAAVFTALVAVALLLIIAHVAS
jgi:hypothetical protein